MKVLTNLCAVLTTNRNHFLNKSIVCSTKMKMFSNKKIFDDLDPKTVEINKELTDLKDKKYYEEYYQEGFGNIYAKTPFKYSCKAGKSYLWCACGRSHTQVCVNQYK